MIEIRITSRGRHLGTRHREAWSAESADGKWKFERLEIEGTPWEASHVDFPGWSALFGSLRTAREHAEAQLKLDLEVNLPNRIARGGLQKAR